MDAEDGIPSVGCPLCDFDSRDASERANEDGGTRKSWRCEAIRIPNVPRGDGLASVHIECIERPIRETVNGMAANHR